MLLSWLVTMASRPKGRHLSRVTLKMAKAESSTSPIAWGRWGGYKTDGIREYYRYDRPTHGRGAPGTSDPSPGGGAPDPRPRDPVPPGVTSGATAATSSPVASAPPSTNAGASIDAQLLLAHALGVTRTRALTHLERVPNASEA